jgi:predicted GNAT superfamily acetyltransferase
LPAFISEPNEDLNDRKLEGKIRMDDTHSTARMLMDMVFAARFSKGSVVIDFPDEESRKRHLFRCIDVFLNGVASPQAPLIRN